MARQANQASGLPCRVWHFCTTPSQAREQVWARPDHSIPRFTHEVTRLWVPTRIYPPQNINSQNWSKSSGVESRNVKGKKTTRDFVKKHTVCGTSTATLQSQCLADECWLAKQAHRAAQTFGREVQVEIARLKRSGGATGTSTDDELIELRRTATGRCLQRRLLQAEAKEKATKLKCSAQQITKAKFDRDIWTARISVNPAKMLKDIMEISARTRAFQEHLTLNGRQSKQYQRDKGELGPGELLIVQDFAARLDQHHTSKTFMSEKLRNETIPDHVFTVYRRGRNGDLEALYTHTLCDSHVREAGGVYIYQTLRLLLEQRIITDEIKRITFWSDGCSRHYKVRAQCDAACGCR